MENDPLYELIQALNPAEKRYFILHNQLSEQKGFMRLFRHLEAAEQYDEGALRAHFAGNSFLRHLPVTKSYLKNAILQSLGDFHLQSQVDFQLRRQLDYVQILYEKGLRSLCMREIRKVKKKALAIGASLVVVEAVKMEIRLLRFKAQGAVEIAQLRELMLGAIRAEQLEAEASVLFDQLFHLVMERLHHGATEVQDEVEGLEQQVIALRGEEGLGIRAKLILLHSLVHCAQLKNQSPQILDYYRQMLDLFGAHPAFTKSRPTMALKTYRGFLEYCVLLDSFADTESALMAMAALPLKGNALKAEAAAVQVYFKLKQADHQELFDQAADLEGEVRQLFTAYPGLIPQSYQVSLWYELAAALISARRYQAANGWLRSILQEPLSEIRKDVREFARMAQLLVWFQMREFDLLEFDLRNTERMLQRREKLTEVDGLLLRFFRQTLSGMDSDDLRASMVQLRQDLQAWQDQGSSHLGLRLVLQWLKGELEG